MDNSIYFFYFMRPFLPSFFSYLTESVANIPIHRRNCRSLLRKSIYLYMYSESLDSFNTENQFSILFILIILNLDLI